MPRTAIARLIGLLFALISVGLSIWFARDASQRSADFQEWLIARPMEIAIDLSTADETTVPFHQTCSISHGEALYFECDLDEADRQKPAELFQGLSGNITVRDTHVNKVEAVGINAKTAYYREARIVLNGFAPFRSGEYTATVQVDSGAPALAHKKQLIYVEYQLCGLERMPATIAGGFALAAGLTSLISASCVLPGLLRNGLWLDRATNSTG